MMNSNTHNYSINELKNDFFASLVVVLVAVPLCLGISIASGMPPEAGLISGIIGGIIVGSLSGCPLQVSGPAAGLVAIVFEIIQEHGADHLGAVLLFAGFIQVIAGLLKLGPWFRAVSPAVIQGMLAGIGILILSSQFHVMVDDLPKHSGIENIISLPKAFLKGVVPMDTSVHHLAAFVGLITICGMFLWKITFKKLTSIPSALVGVLTATVVSYFLKYPIKYVSIPDNLYQAIRFPSLESFSCLLSWEVLVEALTVAFIASAESLLTSTAVDKMQTNHRTNYNKEIIAQGVGNSLAGLVGALPITGVIVRSSANVTAGAKTRVSSFLHGIWILLFVIYFSGLLKVIPTASLAAILVYTGYKLIDLNAIKDLARIGKWEIIIYFTTLLVIVMDSLLEGVLVGIVLSVIKLLYDFSRLAVQANEDLNSNTVHVYIEGNATFINLPNFAEALEKIKFGKNVFIHFEKLLHIDHASLEFLMNWEKQYMANGGIVTIKWDEIETKFYNKTLVNQSK